MLFSQRKGLRPIRSVIQVEALDDDVRNGLWTAVTIWRNHHQRAPLDLRPFDELMTKFWLFYFKKTLDTKPDHNSLFSVLRNRFFEARINSSTQYHSESSPGEPDIHGPPTLYLMEILNVKFAAAPFLLAADRIMNTRIK